MQWLCDCYLPSLWRFVYTRVNCDHHLAEDITSETILAMLNSIQSRTEDPGDTDISNPAGWLRTVAERRISDHFRAASRVMHLLQQIPNRQADTSQSDPARQHELAETRQEVRRAMDDLPDQFRLALEWKYLEKLSVREIAARWDLTEKAVESILFRARREFRARMQMPLPMEESPSTESSGNGQRSRPLESTPTETAQEEDAAHESI